MHSQIKKQGRGGFDLRPYQDEALNRFRELYDDGTNRQLLAAAVGTGKTVVAAHLPAWFPHLGRQGFLWIVHREELAYQAAETFKQCWPNRSVGIEMADHTASRHCDIVVASRQTLAHPKSDRLQKFDRQDDFGVIGIDEAHHATRDSQYDLICNYFGVGSNQDFPMSSGKKRLLTGFTATPNRHDGEGLHHFFDEITKSYDLRWGVEQGWLVDITATRIDTDTDISGVSSRMGDFAASELEEAVDTHERNEVIAKAFLEHGGKKALAYTVGVDQAHSLAHELNQHGINAKALDAKTPDDERKETVERFKNGDLQVVSNVGVLTEGFNAPAADTILMARPTKSEMLYNQILGRATRPTVNLNGLSKSERLQRINSSDKPHMRIIDFVDAVGNHEIVTAPSLFGLTQDFDTKGESITHAIKHIEAKERENPGKPFREAASLDEVEIIAEQTSVWDIATSTDEVPFDCDLMWMQTGETRYELQVPVEEDIRAKGKTYEDVNRSIYFILEQDRIGRWTITERHVPVYRKRGEIYPPKNRSGTAGTALQDAVVRVEDYVTESYPDSLSLIKQDMDWHKDPVSEGQIGYLQTLGVTIPEGKDLTKGEASRLISAAKAERHT